MSDELFPAGVFRGRATTWDLGNASNGNAQVAVLFAITEPGFEGQSMAWYGSFAEKAVNFTLKALRNCGWKGIDLDNLEGLDANEVNLVIEHETYNGKTQAKVQWVNAIGAGLLKNVMDSAAKRAFAASMRGVVAAFDQSAPKATARSSQSSRPPQGRPPEPPPHTDDDMPF